MEDFLVARRSEEVNVDSQLIEATIKLIELTVKSHEG